MPASFILLVLIDALIANEDAFHYDAQLEDWRPPMQLQHRLAACRLNVCHRAKVGRSEKHGYLPVVSHIGKLTKSSGLQDFVGEEKHSSWPPMSLSLHFEMESLWRSGICAGMSFV